MHSRLDRSNHPVTPRLLACLLAASAALGMTTIARAARADDKPAKAGDDPKAAAVAPLLDENGNPFPPARPKPADFNAEIAATRFAELAMADALMEIALGELVQRQGQAPAVKDLGHRLVADHAAIKLILTKSTTGNADALPTQLNADQQQVLARLAALNGADLDREFLWEETLRQPRQAAMYRWQYENCDDKRLKQFAVGTLPIIVVHARVCDEVHKKVNADEIAVQEKRAAAERKAEQERKQAEAQAAADAAAKKGARKFKK